MTAVRVLIGAALGTIALVSAAGAADMPQSWPSYEPPRVGPLLSGWYMRADVGYRWNRVDGLDSGTVSTSNQFKDSVGATIGGGFRYQWFRTDITLDYGAGSDFRAYTAAPVQQSQYIGTVNTITGLLNGYIDFGSWWGFTPYVGAGIGASRVRIEHYADTSIAVPGMSSNGARTNFSWAWMAGVAIQVKPQWLVDVGYRHIDLGGTYVTTGTGLPNDFMNITKHSTDEIRVGLRYLFD